MVVALRAAAENLNEALVAGLMAVGTGERRGTGRAEADRTVAGGSGRGRIEF